MWSVGKSSKIVKNYCNFWAGFSQCSDRKSEMGQTESLEKHPEITWFKCQMLNAFQGTGKNSEVKWHLCYFSQFTDIFVMKDLSYLCQPARKNCFYDNGWQISEFWSFEHDRKKRFFGKKWECQTIPGLICNRDWWVTGLGDWLLPVIDEWWLMTRYDWGLMTDDWWRMANDCTDDKWLMTDN
jgi:hypothetical protein